MPPDTLPRAEKGRFAPPPALRGPAQAVSVEIQSWPGVIASTHWHFSGSGRVDGVDFYVGEMEMGHIHLDGEIHLATSAGLRRALVARRLARPFPYYATWVEADIGDAAGAERATWLFRLNHRRLRGEAEERLIAEIYAAGM